MDEKEFTEAGADLENVAEQIREGIRSGKYSWNDIRCAVMAKTRQAAVTTDEYVHENPWKVVGIAGGIGFVLGLLMAPRPDLNE